ncbi:serine/threonine-protein phosphatase 6 regulatory ankyrin repeat subunit B-like isoform X1 [Pecten maximus]|uniref:serine/threonine-protein phosphatase 6 regulatory ankyrin repeat subunit B-like isoform X1 n=1 Tax=Pecten maximus TaxID=6579 RepID=UPI0014589D8E|nr:serine/threonine-protein phosphatase 6 regulatory ankyrin repeat subunit B-like isoform X1 [Pecten maximus]
MGKLLSQTLLDACQVHGNIAVLMELVNHEADLSFCTACVSASEKKHKCPLECAAEAGDHETVHFLLQCGANVPHSKWKFWDFLKVAAESQDTFVCNVPFIKQLSRCCRSKGTYVNTTMEEFVERGLKLNPSIDYDRKQFFFDCLLLIGINDNLYHAFKTTVLQTEKLPADGQCENSCHKVLESFLDPDLEFRTLATLANVEFDMLNEKNKSGNTPLAKAVLLGKSHKILSQMLLLNANTDETDSNGRTALHLAIISSHPDLWVRKFVNTLAGPNICCKDIMDVTPVQLCMGKGRHRITTLRRLLEIQRKESALPTSLVHDCINMSLPEEDMLEILSVLKDIGVNPNTGDGCKCKPIARAAKHSHFNIVNALLQWNAEVDDIDSHENTLLHYCCFADARNGEKILDIYSKYHSKNVTTINRQNKVGRNAIMAYLADPSLTYSSNIIWRLLNMEPDLTIQDAEKNTALHYLMQSTLPDEEVLNFTQVMVNDFRVSISICNARSLSPLMAALSAKKSRYKTVKFILSLPEHQTPILSSEMGVLHHCITSCMADHEVHEISQTLIQHWGVSTNKPDVTGLSPLLASIQHSSSRCRTIALILKCSSGELCTGVLSELIKHSRLDVDVVQAMHKANIPIFKTVDQLGYSIFHFLIQNASHFHAFPELVASFLPFGHDINHIDSEGLSPLFHACRENYPESIVSSLLSNGARGHISTRKESALHICIRSKRNDSETMDIVSAILRSKTVEINTPDSYHTTALAEAISQGKLLTAKTLLENGADPNIPDRENRTVLHHSVAGNWSDQKTCAFLQLFLPVCQIDRHDGDDRSALNIAACHVSFSRIFSILKLLSAGSSNKTVDRLGRSPLHNTLRCLTGNLACCKLERLCRIEIFLSFSMSPICKDDDGETAIDACSKENMLDEIKLLNRKHKAIGLCEEIMSMLQLGEGNSDPGCLTFTEDIDKTVVNEDMHRILKEVAYNLHEINISIL